MTACFTGLHMFSFLHKVDPFPSTFHIQSFSRCPVIVILVSLETLPSLPTLFLKWSAASWTNYWDFMGRNNLLFLTPSLICTCWNRICHFYKSTQFSDSSCCLSTVTPGYFLTYCDLAKSMLVAFFLQTAKTVSEEHKKHYLTISDCFWTFSSPEFSALVSPPRSLTAQTRLCLASPEFLQLFSLYRLHWQSQNG